MDFFSRKLLEHLELPMFGNSSQEIFSAVAFLRAQVNTSSGLKSELAFVLCKARVAPMEVMTFPKLELQAALLAVRLKQDICRALLCVLTKFFCGPTALLSCSGSNPQASSQYLLKTAYARFYNILALMNGTKLPQAIIRQMPVLVVCPLRFCDQVAGWGVQISCRPRNSR